MLSHSSHHPNRARIPGSNPAAPVRERNTRLSPSHCDALFQILTTYIKYSPQFHEIYSVGGGRLMLVKF